MLKLKGDRIIETRSEKLIDAECGWTNKGRSITAPYLGNVVTEMEVVSVLEHFGDSD